MAREGLSNSAMSASSPALAEAVGPVAYRMPAPELCG